MLPEDAALMELAESAQRHEPDSEFRFALAAAIAVPKLLRRIEALTEASIAVTRIDKPYGIFKARKILHESLATDAQAAKEMNR